MVELDALAYLDVARCWAMSLFKYTAFLTCERSGYKQFSKMNPREDLYFSKPNTKCCGAMGSGVGVGGAGS